jgi:hypothetical protein
MDDTLDERVEAVERALTDGETTGGLPEGGEMDDRLREVEGAVADLDDRLSELEAAVQALRGFAGGIDAVDESVERRANAAIARVERLERELREPEGGVGGPGTAERPHHDGGPNGDRRSPRTRDGCDDVRGTRFDSPAADDERMTPEKSVNDGRRDGDGVRAADGKGRSRWTEARSAETLAEAAADTARDELAAERERSDADSEPPAPTLGERLRRLL